MKRTFWITAVVCLALGLPLTGCGAKVQADTVSAGPRLAQVEHEQDGAFPVDHPERFPIVTAGEHVAAPDLKVTGAVSPDVSRNIPVISLASGRVVEIRARIGDTVTKDQLLMRVQSSDISQAFSDYRQALADETLAHAQLERSKLLYEKGVAAKKDLEIAEDTEAKVKVTVETTTERLRLLGAEVSRPSAIVDVYAPVSGVITEQNVTTAGGVKTLDNSPNLFTISDLSHVWIVCDVYENDLPSVHIGEYADIRLNAYPNLVLKGRIGNIGASLDPNIRTAKVRLEVENPGMLRFGMFVTATFRGLDWQRYATVPAPAVLHLHDRDWIYAPVGGRFQRIEVTGGNMLPGNLQGNPFGHQAGSAGNRKRPGSAKHRRTVMIRRIVDYALNNRILVLGVAILLFIWGAISFHNLPVEAYPDVANNYVQVITQWPGRAAEEVEQQVTIPLEIVMNGLPHLIHLRSTSLMGLSSLSLIFDDESENDWNRQKVLERMAQVTLPAGLQPQMGTDWSPVGQIYFYTLRSVNPKFDVMELKSLQDWVLEKEFKSVPNVVDVASFGGPTREYQVRIDPDKLVAYGISLGQVEQQLTNNNVNAGGSFIEAGLQQINVREIGLVSHVPDIAETVIKTQGGTALRIKDIAVVAQGPKIRLGQFGRAIRREDGKIVDNDDVVSGIVLMRKGADSESTLRGDPRQGS